MTIDPDVIAGMPPEFAPENDPTPHIPSGGTNQPGDYPTDDYTGPVNKDGRIPKKRGRKPGSGTGTSSSSGTSRRRTGWAKRNEVEAALNQVMAAAAFGLMFVYPDDALVIQKGGPNITRELCNLAETTPALRMYLETIATPGKYGPLIIAVAGVAVPIAINHNLIPNLGMLGNFGR